MIEPPFRYKNAPETAQAAEPFYALQNSLFAPQNYASNSPLQIEAAKNLLTKTITQLNLVPDLRPQVRVHALTAQNCTTTLNGRRRHNVTTPEGLAFSRYAWHSLNTWQNLIRSGGTAYVADKQTYLDISNCAGTYLIEIVAVEPHEMMAHDLPRERSLAFGLITVGKEGIVDLADFPKEYQLLPSESIARLREVLVIPTEIAFPSAQITDQLFEALFTLTGDRTIITRIVCEPEHLAYVWSIIGLGRRGFKEVNNPLERLPLKVSLERPDGRFDPQEVTIKDGVFVFDPKSPNPAFLERKATAQSLRQELWDKYAASINFPSNNLLVGLWSDRPSYGELDAFARIQDGNHVLTLNQIEEASKTFRHNLSYVDHALPPGTSHMIAVDAGFSANMLRSVENTLPEHDTAVYEECLQLWRLHGENFVHQMAMHLKPGAPFCVREIMLPDEWPAQVEMKLFEQSERSLFERYAKEAYGGKGIEYNDCADGYVQLAASEALKFALIVKNYPHDFLLEKEIAPPCFTLSELVRTLNSNGFRVDAAQVLPSEYVLRTFLANKVTFRSPGTKAPLPLATGQCEIFGERLRSKKGAVCVRRSAPLERASEHFLQSRYYVRDTNTGSQFRHVISRKDPNVYCLQIFRRISGSIALLGRQGFQRPIRDALFNEIAADGAPCDFPLDTSVRSGFTTEGLVVVPKNSESPEEAIRRFLREQLRIPEQLIPTTEQLQSAILSATHFPSDGTIDETWFSVDIELPPEAFVESLELAHSKFPSGNIVRLFDAQDIVSATKGTASSSSVLTNAAYRILLQQGLSFRSWTGNISLQEQTFSASVTPISEIHYGAHKTENVWRKVQEMPNPFFKILKASFSEYDRSGTPLVDSLGNPSAVELELATIADERNLTNNTLVLAPVIRTNNSYLLGLETVDDRPLIALRLQLSQIEIAPAMRIARDVEGYMQGTIEDRALAHFENAAHLSIVKDATGDYHKWTLSPELLVTAGATPERAYLRLVEVDAASAAGSSLRFFNLRELLDSIESIPCGHTKSIIYRSAHALGLLQTTPENLLIS